MFTMKQPKRQTHIMLIVNIVPNTTAAVRFLYAVQIRGGAIHNKELCSTLVKVYCMPSN